MALITLTWLVTAVSASAQDAFTVTVTLKSGKHAHTNNPICIPLSLPARVAQANEKYGNLATIRWGKKNLIGQLTAPGLTTEHIKPKNKDMVRRDLHFMLPELAVGATKEVECVIRTTESKEGVLRLQWTRGGTSTPYLRGESGKRPLLLYMGEPYDPSTPDTRNRTYKVFHHMFSPGSDVRLTNGGYADVKIGDTAGEKKLLYPHHRGLMFGFNRITYDGNKKADTWHCRGDDYVKHVKTLSTEEGPVLGRHRVLIDWHGSEKDVFAKEERELTAYNLGVFGRYGKGTMVEFASRLKTTGGPVKLDGDPQHAGFQFRAANEVAEKHKNKTYFLRVNSKGEPGATINWSGKNPPKGTVDVPWKAMSFVVGNKRYTVAYLDHPRNPGEARHSERNYGRFGYYFQYELTKDNPLLVNYRIWLQNGEMTREEVEGLSQEFVSPPEVSVKY